MVILSLGSNFALLFKQTTSCESEPADEPLVAL